MWVSMDWKGESIKNTQVLIYNKNVASSLKDTVKKQY